MFFTNLFYFTRTRNYYYYYNNVPAKFNMFKSTNHLLNTIQMTKLCLNAFDDKSFILEDVTNTLPYSHYNTV